MRTAAALCLVSILVTGCTDDREGMKTARLYITGDAKSVGAEIFVDGEKVGVMEKRVYSGPMPSEEKAEKQRESQKRLGIKPTEPMKPGDVFAVGVDIKIKKGEKDPEYGIYNDIRIPLGKHEILFVGRDGKHLKRSIEVKGESYINVDFEKLAIAGG